MPKCIGSDDVDMAELFSVEDEVIAIFCDLGQEHEGDLTECVGQIFGDILTYTEAVRMGKLPELLNTHPTIKVLGDFLVGRSKGFFVAGFERFEFVLRTDVRPAIRVVAVMLRRETLS